MRYILLIPISLYWKMIPQHKRRSCLFCESCSVYVYRLTRIKGFRAGLKALKTRIGQCRPGYILYIRNNAFVLQVKNGDIIPEERISKNLLALYQDLFVRDAKNNKDARQYS